MIFSTDEMQEHLLAANTGGKELDGPSETRTCEQSPRRVTKILIMAVQHERHLRSLGRKEVKKSLSSC